MKKLYPCNVALAKLYSLFAMVIIVAASNGQGTNCNTAVLVDPKSTCIYQSYQTPAGSNVMWFFFVAESTNVNISVVTTKFGINAPHIHQLALGGGTCGNIVVFADDELPFEDNADQLNIDLNASGLIIGQTYFIRVKREATDTCDKVSCKANNSTDPTVFDLCVENVNVIIPLDFGLESPAISHAYHQNRGQLIDLDGNPRPDIKLYTVSANPAVYLSDTAVSYVFAKISDDTTVMDTLHRVDMTLEGTNPSTRVFKTEQIPGITNYYLAHIPKGITRNKGFSRAVMNDVYPNIDMQFYSNAKGVKYYFIVRPGGDADDIVMKFDGATAVNVTPDSSKLEIITSIGTLDFEAGHAYQVNPGNQIVPMPWQAKFIKTASNKVKLDIRNYPHNMPLFIQIDRGHAAPAATAAPKWCTFFGGTEDDYASDITVDNSGNIYIVGTTSSLEGTFPVTVDAFQGVLKGNKDVFAAKFDFNYARIWATYYGGNNADYGFGIAHSAYDDKIYITGESNSNISTLITAALAGSPNSFVDNTTGTVGFIARLTSDQGLRTWATRFGGYQTRCNKVKADNAGNIYVAGRTSNNATPEFTCNAPVDPGRFPICNPGGGAYVQNYHGGGNSNFYDGFIAKFNSATELKWSTFFGGSGDWDEINSIAIDNTNNQIYIAGSTNSPLVTPYSTCTPPTNGSFPLCEGAGGYYQDQVNADNNFSLGPFTDAFIAKFTASGILEWSSFFGAYNEDYGTDIAVNSLGQVYITGYTNSNQYTWTFCQPPVDGSIGDEGFPRCFGSQSYMQNFSNGGANNGFGESWDAFIAKFDYPVPDLLWSTFIGGDRGEKNTPVMYTATDAPKIAIDYNDRVHMSGITRSGCYVGDETAPLAQNPLYYYQPQGHADNAYDINCSAMDGFVASFNADDSPYLGTYFGGLGNDFAAGIAVFLDRIYVVGGSYSTSQFPLSCPADVPNPYCQGYTTVSASKHDAFIAQIRASNVQLSVEPKQNPPNSLLAFPNPSSGKFTIDNLPGIFGKINITVYNCTGQKVYENSIHSSAHSPIDLSVLSNGLYYIKLNSDKNTINSKIIIQH